LAAIKPKATYRAGKKKRNGSKTGRKKRRSPDRKVRRKSCGGPFKKEQEKKNHAPGWGRGGIARKKTPNKSVQQTKRTGETLQQEKACGGKRKTRLKKAEPKVVPGGRPTSKGRQQRGKTKRELPSEKRPFFWPETGIAPGKKKKILCSPRRKSGQSVPRVKGRSPVDPTFQKCRERG